MDLKYSKIKGPDLKFLQVSDFVFWETRTQPRPIGDEA